jgi:hypothetical protein
VNEKGTVLFILFLLFGAAACRPPLPALAPPAELRDLAGNASLKITGPEGTARSKFSYALALPDRGRVDVLDPLGRTALQFLVEGEEAYLVLPSKRAYGQGSRNDVLEKFLGFPVGLEELAGLLAGRWEKADGTLLPGWSFERDARGRVSAGSRGDLSFEVPEHFPGNGVPRRLSFRGPSSEGTVTLLPPRFNRGFAPFSWSFRDRFKLLSWDEVERLLRDES